MTGKGNQESFEAITEGQFPLEELDLQTRLDLASHDPAVEEAVELYLTERNALQYQADFLRLGPKICEKYMLNTDSFSMVWSMCEKRLETPVDFDREASRILHRPVTRGLLMTEQSGGAALTESTPMGDQEQKVANSIVAREQILAVVRLYVWYGKQTRLTDVYLQAHDRCGGLLEYDEVRDKVDSLIPVAEAEQASRRDRHND